MSLKSMNIGGWECLINEEFGYAPYFTNWVKQRMQRKLANNFLITGEAGIGKSHQGWSFCRVWSKRFSIDDVVSSYSDYMEQLMKPRRTGVPLMVDEPQYAMDHRDWYMEVNKMLVKTMTSQRFRLRPLILSIIHPSLIDKTIRSYLIQGQIVMHDRGNGWVYIIQPSQYEDKIYRHRLCRIEYGQFDRELCSRDSCLDCKTLMKEENGEYVCNIFRAQYERKKIVEQNTRDKQSQEQALTIEAKGKGQDYLLEVLYKNKLDLKNDNGIVDVQKIISFLYREEHLRIGKTKAYTLRGLLLYDHPELEPEVKEK